MVEALIGCSIWRGEVLALIGDVRKVTVACVCMSPRVYGCGAARFRASLQSCNLWCFLLGACAVAARYLRTSFGVLVVLGHGAPLQQRPAGAPGKGSSAVAFQSLSHSTRCVAHHGLPKGFADMGRSQHGTFCAHFTLFRRWRPAQFSD